MKTLVAVVALAIAAAIASPVFAKSKHPKTPKHPVVVNTPDGQRHSSNPAYDVYVAGT
jgi:hypothetical protein